MEKTFAFAVVWSLGASVDAESRSLVDRCIRQLEHSFPPGHTVYDYFLNYEKQDWKLWEDRLPSQYRSETVYGSGGPVTGAVLGPLGTSKPYRSRPGSSRSGSWNSCAEILYI